MPLYEYECQQCRRHTEKRQKFSDVEITVCPHCGGHLQRVITAPAIAFKGGGWYADGYGNAKPKASGEAKSSEGKTESAPVEASAKSPSGESSGAAAAAPTPTTPAAPSAPAPSNPKT